MTSLLNYIPFNGIKSYILLGLYLLVLGAGAAQMLDAGTVTIITNWLEPLIGLSLAHKIAKIPPTE